MKGKVSKNKFLKVVLPALLVVAIICQAVGFQAVLAKGNVATTSLITYPNVQQYTKEAGQDFTLAENSRIFVVANEKTLNNSPNKPLAIDWFSEWISIETVDIGKI